MTMPTEFSSNPQEPRPLTLMRRNYANLLKETEQLSTKIASLSQQSPTNYGELAKLYELRKKLTKKKSSLLLKISFFYERTLPKKVPVVRKHDGKWFSEYPALDDENATIVAGKNAKMSTTIAKKMNLFDRYYHIANSTGGSVFFKIKNSLKVAEYHHYCIQFATVFSKFWNTSSDPQSQVIFTDIKNVKKLKKPGAFFVKLQETERRVIDIILYWNAEAEDVTYVKTNHIFAYLIRDTADTYVTLKPILKSKGLCKAKYLQVLRDAITLLPAKGRLVKPE